MFYIQPFEKTESIRSALGFMSLSSRWGNVLFPGITVLTRDLRDIQALHLSATNEMAKRKPNWESFRSHRNDEKVAKQLIELLKYGSTKEFTQRMSYWQRYGSLLNHFNLLTSDQPLSFENYRRMLFDTSYKPRRGQPWEKNQSQRKSRILHADWFRDVGQYIQKEVTRESLDEVLNTPISSWWLTGLGPPSRGVPETIKLARQMEFALVVWQSTFEAAVKCIQYNKPIPSRSRMRRPHLLKAFFDACLRCHESSETLAYQDVVSHGLEIQEAYFRKNYFDNWSTKLQEILLKQQSTFTYDQLTRLHNGELVTDLAKVPAEELLSKLIDLHVKYCQRQNKLGSVYVKSIADKTVSQVFPSLSMELRPGRWGLFGYRFDVSLVLHESRKYQKAANNVR